ncbi:MAG: valine--tRNA ligase [Treponema sp.]|nr:valine--tRNA ligase [Treponema sp.]
MKAVELEKAYNPKTFESRIYALWKDGGSFKPEAAGSAKGADPFTMAIPPPNVTGMLHMGHALNATLQDVIARFHRMRGEPTLWIPGSDHAGIATQHVVEKKLEARGQSRAALGREKFVEETWKAKAEHHAIISEQFARMGSSVDWDRERFTLDDGLARAVREVFVSLHERGLLYKGKYLVNWCPSCGTAIADDEVEHEEAQGKMYRLRYFFADDPSAFLEIATTRPETLLGDTAVAVHPEDPRYAALVGKKLRLPITGREIPVIADSFVDKEFGTGAVKITPAHDPNDWEAGRRHGLEAISVLDAAGAMNDEAPKKYRGMKVAQARAAIVEDLEAGGWLSGEEGIAHSVGHCYRCSTVIEPFLSEQWFVRMKPLAEKALAAWQKGEVVFYPKKWENTYRHWLENIRDWCISRQLWWGHRIPAWLCRACGKTTVARKDPAACAHCGSAEITQDEDVLDTWFSSWLWPFSVLGWESPAQTTADFRAFYPTSAVITGYDILFFWVARMIMAGIEFTGRAPFRDVYLHGLLRDKQGRKMSKSLGNGLDPLELIDEFGADALKFTLAFVCAQGQDLLVDKESFKMGSKFANKVWNASRYILMNLEGRAIVEKPELLPVDRWIYSRLSGAAGAVTEALLSYRFNDAAQSAYEFFWNDFCDWYVEATKLSMKAADDAAGAREKDRAATVLLDALSLSLRLLHPFLPFVTEEIYSKLPGAENRGLLISAPYPERSAELDSPQDEARFSFLQEFVRAIRALRGECAIPPGAKLRAQARVSADAEPFLRQGEELVKMMAGLGELEIAVEEEGGATARPEGAIGLAGSGFGIFVFVAQAVDTGALKEKFAKELARDKGFARGLESKLENAQFVGNAPAELVAGERAKLKDALARVEKLETYLRGL